MHHRQNITAILVGLLVFTPLVGIIVMPLGSGPFTREVSSAQLRQEVGVPPGSARLLEYLEDPENPDSSEDLEDLEDEEEEDGDGDEVDDGEEEDGDGDEVDDKTEASNLRTIEVDVSSSEASISSQLRAGGQKDEISMEIHAEDGGLEFHVEYSRDAVSTGIEVAFSLRFRAVVEFVDDDGDGIYSPGSDTLIQEAPLDSFADFVYSKQAINGSTYLHYIQISDPDLGVTFHVYFVEEFYALNEVLITPTQAKIDIEIEGYPYAHPSSQLGIVTEMDSEADYESDDPTEDEENGYNSTGEEWVETAATEIAGYFSWATQAEVDGVLTDITVGVAQIAGEDKQQITVYYPRADHIFHDPKIGITGILRPPTTVTPPPDDDVTPPARPSLFLFLIPLLIGLAILIMSKQEYRRYLINRVLRIDTGPHQLSIEEVLENEIRDKILSLIIDQPGIHYSEILRSSGVSSSTLAWHLDILETYKIILKQRVGMYLIFYPYLDKNPFAGLDPTIAKSKTTLDIFQIIGDNPGIIQARIAKRMGLDRKTVKYHLNKLVTAELVEIRPEGRKSGIYSIIPCGEGPLDC